MATPLAAGRRIAIRNANIAGAESDTLYHIGMTARPDPDTGIDAKLAANFGDVKLVCMGGSAERAERFAHIVEAELGIPKPFGMGVLPVGKTERYTMYKVGPAICISHGIGMPSLSVLLHELAKLLAYAGATDVTFMRIGTCGGIGVEPGSVVVSTSCVNGKLEPFYELQVLGKTVRRPALLPEHLVALMGSLAEGDDCAPTPGAATPSAGPGSFDSGDKINVVTGLTMSAEGFYEHQGRMDGALCPYTLEERDEWLRSVYDAGVRNFEMEALLLAAFCQEMGIPAVILCTVLVDRLRGDQLRISQHETRKLSENALRLALRFVKHITKL